MKFTVAVLGLSEYVFTSASIFICLQIQHVVGQTSALFKKFFSSEGLPKLWDSILR